MSPPVPTFVTADWPEVSVRRLRWLLAQTTDAAPADLTPLEALALLEWCRMAVFAECHAAGVGKTARDLLRGSLRRDLPV